MDIFRLPNELHEHILHHLPWHDHFLAASVCPLWATILQREPFRRKRHYDELRDAWYYNSYETVHPLVFNREAPKHVDDDGKEPNLSLHALLDRSALEVRVKRGRAPKVIMKIPNPGQSERRQRSRSGSSKSGDEHLPSIPPDFEGVEQEFEICKYNISQSPLLQSDTVIFDITKENDYLVFDDRFAPPPVTLGTYKNSRVHLRVPLEYPIRLGGEKPQSVMGLVNDITSYMNMCFEAKDNLDWIRATFIGFGKVHHTDELHFEFRYGSY
ncbi:hypothetical protein H072_6955 [Dactylellina haptotyla CBS 200.50]|uniref:F-box domain-containing protein n=1 Tax=Dactylellina haptotyla (strain CBS 200.50) TaxID=1284197 RepID=S8BIW1_DACHA|nr:hypothetical protein H072_6955 [Dactylellina haptotyla CBS 200.50]